MSDHDAAIRQARQVRAHVEEIRAARRQKLLVHGCISGALFIAAVVLVAIIHSPTSRAFGFAIVLVCVADVSRAAARYIRIGPPWKDQRQYNRDG